MRRACCIVAALALVLAGCGQESAAARYTVTDDTMKPTLGKGQDFTAREVEPGEYQPARGDVVVFRVPETWARADASLTAGELIVRRVIAVDGDRVSCCDVDGRVYLNGSGLDEPYLATNGSVSEFSSLECGGRRFDELRVPAGETFVMGDNRLGTLDSRCLGTVAATEVVAIVES